MNRETEALLSELAELSGAAVCVMQGEKLLRFPAAIPVPAVLTNDPAFCRMLSAAAEKMAGPFLHRDMYEVFFACIPFDAGSVILGPASMDGIAQPELSVFLSSHGVKEKADTEKIPTIGNSRFLALVQLTEKAVTGRHTDRRDLLEKNGIGNLFRRDLREEQFLFADRQERMEKVHHTYQEERQILEAVRRGDGITAIALSMKMDPDVGDMSRNSMSNRKKLVVTAIALASRAVIDEGVSPQDAYRVSDWNLQKMDACRGTAELMECRNHALDELAGLVRKSREAASKSGYPKRAQSYIAQHYREKIHVRDVAEDIGISPSYLSRVFSKETGVTVEEYITQVRIEKACNLLKYSDASVTQIGEYVRFSSTGYFCQIFKKKTGMLPLAWRAKYKPSGF